MQIFLDMREHICFIYNVNGLQPTFVLTKSPAGDYVKTKISVLQPEELLILRRTSAVFLPAQIQGK